MSFADICSIIRNSYPTFLLSRQKHGSFLQRLAKDFYLYFVLDFGDEYWKKLLDDKELGNEDRNLRSGIAGEFHFFK